MAKRIVCRLDPTGYINSTIYVLNGGYIIHQTHTTVAAVADTISTMCQDNEIEKVALYGPEAHLAGIKQHILKNKTTFAYNNTEILINPTGEDYYV